MSDTKPKPTPQRIRSKTKEGENAPAQTPPPGIPTPVGKGLRSQMTFPFTRGKPRRQELPSPGTSPSATQDTSRTPAPAAPTQLGAKAPDAQSASGDAAALLNPPPPPGPNGAPQLPAPPSVSHVSRWLWQSRWALLATLYTALQQAVFASGSIWLFLGSRTLLAGSNPFPYLIAFLLSQFIAPNIPRVLAQAARMRWIAATQRRFIDHLIAQHKNQPLLWARRDIATKRTMIFASDLPRALDHTISLSVEGLSRIMNFAFNALILAAVIDRWFLLAFLLSALIAYLGYRLTDKARSTNATRAQVAQNTLTAQRSRAWDNVVLGNARNYTMWQQRESHKYQQWREAALRQEDYLASSTLLISLASALPVIVAVCWRATSLYHNGEVALLLSGFLPQLPRIALNVEYGVNLINMLPRYASAKRALEHALAMCDDRRQLAIDRLIRFGELRIESDRGPLSPQQLSDWLQQGHLGRFRIYAENGVGKSLFLMGLKQALGARAALLPAQHHLDFTAARQGSTGQMLMQYIEQLFEEALAARVSVILLDEPKANLDPDNAARVEKLLEVWKTKLAIVEATPQEARFEIYQGPP